MATFLIRTGLTSRLIDAETAEMAELKFLASLGRVGNRYDTDQLEVVEATDEVVSTFKHYRKKKPGEDQISFDMDVESKEPTRRTNPT